MPIKMHLKKNNFQMMWEFKGLEVLSTSGNIAIVGNVMNSYMTEGKINSLFKKLYSVGNKVYGFLNQERKDAMEQDARTKCLLSKGNINIVVDWKQFKFGADMKFTGIILNPPYGNLHLPILKDSLEHADWEHDAQVVCIHPANWLQFPTRERPDWMNGKMKDFYIIDRKTASNLFDIDSGDLVISEFCKNGKSFQIDPANDPEFCCFKFNSRFEI